MSDSAAHEQARVVALEKGAAWLVAQQAADGGWHSATYGALRGGAAVTSLALYALARLPADMREKHAVASQRGLASLRPALARKKCVANADGSFDYPEYASALLLSASRRCKWLTATEETLLAEFLLNAQLAKQRGFEETHAEFGGWDLLGTGAAAGLTSGTNVSLAAFALEALAGEWPGMELQARVKNCREWALGWLGRCQQRPGDGGFAFTVNKTSDAQKALWSDKERKQPRSYGSATADGLRALAAAGVAATDERRGAAVVWLSTHADLKHVPGFNDDAAETGWREGLWFYYVASLAGSFAHWPAELVAVRRLELQQALMEKQKSSGEWRNDSARMREDDPLLATSLALVGLGA